MSLRAGAVDGVRMPGAARDMAYLLQQGTSREAEATARELGRLPYSRSSVERVGHVVGAKFVAQHQQHDAEGDAVHTIRYGTMPDGDPGALCEGLASDVLAILRKRRGLSVALLCDGAPEMWNLLDDEFDATTFAGFPLHRLIDYWHAIEKLAAATHVLVAKAETSSLLSRWKFALLNRSAARAAILRELIDSGKEDVRVGDSRPVHDAITYLTNNAARMDHAHARRVQGPIGSGNVEATCKSLVAVRMKRPGSRWKTDSGEHVIHFALSGSAIDGPMRSDITLRPPRAAIRVAAWIRAFGTRATPGGGAAVPAAPVPPPLRRERYRRRARASLTRPAPGPANAVFAGPAAPEKPAVRARRSRTEPCS